MTQIHPTAVIDPGTRLGHNVSIGPYTCIGPDCHIGDDVVIGPHVTIARNTRIGAKTQIHSHACLGGDPQDLSYQGQTTWLEIGQNVQIRELVTIHRATRPDQPTRIGDHSLLMTSVHIGHDCQLGHHVIIASSSVLGGHAQLDEHAFISGLCAIHQHCRVGAYSIIGGSSATRKDIPPFCKASGFPTQILGLNSVGLRRAGFSSESRMALKRAYKTLWLQGLNLSQGLSLLEASEDALDPCVSRLLDFIRSSQRGIVSHGKELYRTLEENQSSADAVMTDITEVVSEADVQLHSETMAYGPLPGDLEAAIIPPATQPLNAESVTS